MVEEGVLGTRWGGGECEYVCMWGRAGGGGGWGAG